MRRIVISLFFASLASLVGHSSAQVIVNDPAALAHQLLQYAQLQAQLRTQLAMIERLGISVNPHLNAALDEIDALVRGASGIAYQVASVVERFEALYQASVSAESFEEIAALSVRWESALRQSVLEAMQMQAQVLTNERQLSAETVALVHASKNAAGQTQAQQAGNQLLALAIGQLAQMQKLMATHARAIESQFAADNAERARSEAFSQFLWQDFGETSMPPVPSPFGR